MSDEWWVVGVPQRSATLSYETQVISYKLQERPPLSKGDVRHKVHDWGIFLLPSCGQ